MGRRKRLTTVSVDHGRLVLHELNDAFADGVVTPVEQRRLGSRIEAWYRTALAADASQALGHALERGIGDPVYLNRLVGAYQAHVDELDPLEAA